MIFGPQDWWGQPFKLPTIMEEQQVEYRHLFDPPKNGATFDPNIYINPAGHEARGIWEDFTPNPNQDVP